MEQKKEDCTTEEDITGWQLSGTLVSQGQGFFEKPGYLFFLRERSQEKSSGGLLVIQLSFQNRINIHN